ncbi:sulfatase-like hydrolase/transferase [Vibrio sp. WXL210]|uniref:sulfatase-like hydrolase/transferase n=1 Tax=Vibrio sp. WXL210 TaxID=3450709 RepID=UPI003EC8A4B5
MKYKSLCLALAGCLSACSADQLSTNQSTFSPGNVTQSQPNILMIMVDDLGWEDLNVYGNHDIDTPNLDRLAEQGMLFRNAYASAPVCSPSRAGAITGQYPARLGLTNHISPHDYTPENAVVRDAPTLGNLPAEATTFAEALRDNGYRTGFFGKWHLNSLKPGGWEAEFPETQPENRGFDVAVAGGPFGGPLSWYSPYKNPYITDGPEGEYLPTRLANEVISFMGQESPQPFLAVMWNYLVHSPLQAPEELLEKYQLRKKQGKKVGMPVFAGMIEAMDTSVGKVLDAVDEMNLTNDTLIVFTSDNGGIWKVSDNGGLKLGKGWPYEGGVRVPLIVRWPGKVPSNTVSQERVINVDFFPTFLSLANVDSTQYENIDGIDITSVLTENKQLERDAIFFHYPNYAWHAKNRLSSAMIEGDFKLISYYDDNTVELYNLKKDPWESRNLAKRNKDVADSMKVKLDRWLEETNAEMPIRIEQ